MSVHKALVIGIILILVGGSVADPNDFVNPKYVVVAKNDAKTRGARDRIIRDGKSSAKKGPWSITNSQVRAASGDPRDYLSWAPYHWPNCNWCGKANAASTTSTDPDAEEQQVRSQSASFEEEPSNDFMVPASNNGSISVFERIKRQLDTNDPFRVAPNSSLGWGLLDMMGDIFDLFLGIEKQELGATEGTPSAATHALEELESIKVGMDQFKETLTPENGSPIVEPSSTETSTMDPEPTGLKDYHLGDQLAARDLTSSPESTSLDSVLAMPTSLAHTSMAIPPLPPSSTTTSTVSPREPEEVPLRAHRSTKSCAPSPTKSMSPQATWSSCPYKARDGKVNPDTRGIKSSAYIGQMSQSVLWNAIAAAVASGSKSHEKSAADFINAFFLDNKSKMNPKVEFGQVVRGPPGTQAGSYMGILDMRSLVKVVNAILVLRETQSPYWTQDLDAKMKTWAAQYAQWVEASAVGKKAARAANNHGSFYPNQIAALKILSGDTAGARMVLQSYFDNQFQDQIVASGEQPLEAVRTRPFHYRCFNLEAMITNAKLGDYIGINYWSTRTKYGATIQTAVDYLISLDPGNEPVENALPHVAAIAAAYGDPRRKYANYLKSGNRNYDKKSYWFYNQPAAISNKPKGKRDIEDGTVSTTTSNSSESPMVTANPEDPMPNTNSEEPDNVEATGVDQDHPPAMFANGRLVELEEGFFVGWDDVREFYRKMTPIRRRAHEPEQAETPPPMFQDGKGVELEDGLGVGWDDISSYYEPSAVPTSI